MTGAGLFLLAVALLLWLRLRGKEKAGASRADPASERNALVQAIADLDDARAAGLIETEEYQAQRRRLLDRLLAMAEKGGALPAHARTEV